MQQEIRESREFFASRPVPNVSRHPKTGSRLASPRNLRLGALMLVLIAINQLEDPMIDATIGEELLYWLARNCVLAAGLWTADILVSRTFSGRLEKPDWLKPVVLVSVIGLLPIALAEQLIEPLLPMRPEFRDDDLWAFSPVLAFLSEYATVVTVVIPIHLLLWLVIDRKAHGGASRGEPLEQSMPEFLKRSSVPRLDDVLALQAEEHYVRIYTRNGAELVHCRFSDAVAAMPGERGLQVHRSWWVAESAIRSAKRGSRRWQLDLESDVAVPISDSYVKAVRDRGWLKKKRQKIDGELETR